MVLTGQIAEHFRFGHRQPMRVPEEWTGCGNEDRRRELRGGSSWSDWFGWCDWCDRDDGFETEASSPDEGGTGTERDGAEAAPVDGDGRSGVQA